MSTQRILLLKSAISNQNRRSLSNAKNSATTSSSVGKHATSPENEDAAPPTASDDLKNKVAKYELVHFPLSKSKDALAYYKETHNVNSQIRSDWHLDILSLRSPRSCYWGKWRIRKDVKYRMLVQDRANEQLCLKAMTLAQMLPNTVRDEAAYRLAKMPRYSIPTNLHTNDILFGRGRGLVAEWKLNRMTFRHSADYARISGVTRAIW